MHGTLQLMLVQGTDMSLSTAAFTQCPLCQKVCEKCPFHYMNVFLKKQWLKRTDNLDIEVCLLNAINLHTTSGRTGREVKLTRMYYVIMVDIQNERYQT